MLFAFKSSQKKPRQPKVARVKRASPRTTPSLEVLEDRCLPAAPPSNPVIWVTRTDDMDVTGTLRWAIDLANRRAGLDAIRFNIANAPTTINIEKALPDITSRVIIDAATWPPGKVSQTITLKWNGGMDKVADGLTFITDTRGDASYSEVYGLTIREFTGNGIFVRQASGIRIGGSGVGQANTLIRNDKNGIHLDGSGATENRIIGNYIGTDKNSNTALRNKESGILVVGSFKNYIGGLAAGERNVIGKNGIDGIRLVSSPLNHIAGNYIGTDSNGNNLGNEDNGIYIGGSNPYGNVIGAAVPAPGGIIKDAANVISANKGNGIWIRLNSVSEVTTEIIGNSIGTKPNGTEKLGNVLAGVKLTRTKKVTIGSKRAEERNVISDNNTGVEVEFGATQNSIFGNSIGGGKNPNDTTVKMGNKQYGIAFDVQSKDNTVKYNPSFA